jgi:hypothetical protein
MKAKVMLVAVGTAALLASGIAYAVDRSSPGYHGEIKQGSRPAADCQQADPPCPETLPAATLSTNWDEGAVGFQFVAPPDGVQPKIDSTEAVNIAWAESPAASTSQQATLVLIPKGGNFPSDVLAWVVRYDGYCALAHRGTPIDGKPLPDQTCHNQPLFTMIDASTGEFIVSWTRAD